MFLRSKLIEKTAVEGEKVTLVASKNCTWCNPAFAKTICNLILHGRKAAYGESWRGHSYRGGNLPPGRARLTARGDSGCCLVRFAGHFPRTAGRASLWSRPPRFAVA